MDTNHDMSVLNSLIEMTRDNMKGFAEAALQDSELTPATHQVIEEAYTSVHKGRDRASAMKQQMARPSVQRRAERGGRRRGSGAHRLVRAARACALRC
jgi:hypothetical protein